MEEIIFSHSSAAIDNLSSGYEGLTQLRALFVSSSPARPTTKTLAIGLLDKALHCITAALSEVQTITPSLINSATAPTVEDRTNVTGSKKRKRIQSWTITTSVPHFDGHQWRKYGQKRIQNSEFPRSYYKCTHNKDQGCPATKMIQQKEDKITNPPKYKVSYTMHHTCKPIETHGDPFVMDSSAIINSTSSTTASSTYSSQAESSDQPQALPLQVEETEQDCLMESMLLSLSEPRVEANDTEDSCKRFPLGALDFDWGWHDELIGIGEFGAGIV